MSGGPLRNDRPTMCGVCGRIGEYKAGAGFRHSDQDVKDHLYVPVAVADAPEQVQLRCDFCNTDDGVNWMLPARDFPIPGQSPRGEPRWSRGAWTACGVCADMLRDNAWHRLVNRAVEARVQNNPYVAGLMRRDFVVLYRLLRANALGSVRPYDIAMSYNQEPQP